jgi:hypothetical protein
MADLDRLLAALAAEVVWPPAPDVAARLELGRRRRARPLVVAVAVALLALAVALAVPTARSALLRLFGLGGVTIERVETLPPAQAESLSAGLGPRLTDAEATAALGTPFRPGGHGPVYGEGGAVSTLLAGPVLLSEFASPVIAKKLVATGTTTETVEIAPGVEGVWIAGAPHVVTFFPSAAPRLAGNVLVWARGGVTFRLEGPGLTERAALGLARELDGT